ncbi:MAG: hypothetical protein ACYCPN_06270 [Thermoplasmata archaeon]
MTASRAQAVYPPGSVAGELPILVGILAILVALFGILLIVLGGLAVLAGLGIVSFSPISLFGFTSNSTLLLGAFTLIFGIILTSVASGLWNTETWALWLTGIVTAAVIGLLVWSSSFGIALLIAVVLLIYLVAVRRHFE